MNGGEGSLIGGRYTLLRRLGSGGMAEVWLATDQRLGDKHVAVKRLLGYRADSPESAQDVERARREALAASRLNHANLVAVTDFVAEDGEPFIVMEYVEGMTLFDVIADGGLPTARAARIIGQVAGALVEAHDAGIIHRDIKPANILVTRRDVAKLADFGIARSAGDVRLTRTGFFTGTVGYLAPELLDGSEATSASDVWALGAVLFETVEGRPAFDGDTTASLIAAIVLKDLPVATLSPELAPLVARMLLRDPVQRIAIDDAAAELADIAARVGARDAARETPIVPPAAPTTTRLASSGPPPVPSGPPASVPPQSAPRPSEPRPSGPPPSGPPPSGPPGTPFPPTSQPGRRSRGRWVLAAVVVVALAAGILVFALTRGGGHPTAASHDPTGSRTSTSGGSSIGTSSTASNTTSTGNTSGSGSFKVLAHRGGRESYTEQTAASLVQAAKDGYGVETDVRWTSDGVALLTHDATTAGNLDCTGGPYTVSRTTYAVLERNCHTPADASPDGQRTYPIPTFEQVAAQLKNIPNATLFVEVKTTQTATQVREFLSILQRNSLIDHAVVTSAYPAELAKIRTAALALGTTLQLLLFVTDATTRAASLRSQGLSYVAVEIQAATKTYLSSLHAAGLTTVVWTVDTSTQWAAARAAGADYVLTDVPHAYLTWLGSR